MWSICWNIWTILLWHWHCPDIGICGISLWWEPDMGKYEWYIFNVDLIRVDMAEMWCNLFVMGLIWHVSVNILTFNLYFFVMDHISTGMGDMSYLLVKCSLYWHIYSDTGDFFFILTRYLHTWNLFFIYNNFDMGDVYVMWLRSLWYGPLIAIYMWDPFQMG